jgi:hypothetical protein
VCNHFNLGIDVKNVLGAAVILSMITGVAIAAPISQASGKTCIGSWVNEMGYTNRMFVKPIAQSDGSTDVTVWLEWRGATQPRDEPNSGTPVAATFKLSPGTDKVPFKTIKGTEFQIQYNGSGIVAESADSIGVSKKVELPCHTTATS